MSESTSPLKELHPEENNDKHDSETEDRNFKSGDRNVENDSLEWVKNEDEKAELCENINDNGYAVGNNGWKNDVEIRDNVVFKNIPDQVNAAAEELQRVGNKINVEVEPFLMDEGKVIVSGCEDVQHIKERSNDDTDEFNIPIDRGWAWMVVLGAFFIHVVVIGGCKSFGVLYVLFQDRYQASAGALSTGMSLPIGLVFALGIVANMLSAKLTCRLVVFVGGILGCIGFFLTAFMPEFLGVIFMFGIVGGFAFSLCYSPCIVMVGQHFRKYRSFAMGISVSGSGVGTFVIPNLMRVMVREYGLPGCLIIFSGIVLNLSVIALLFRPWSSYGRKRKEIDELVVVRPSSRIDVGDGCSGSGVIIKGVCIENGNLFEEKKEKKTNRDVGDGETEKLIVQSGKKLLSLEDWCGGDELEAEKVHSGLESNNDYDENDDACDNDKCNYDHQVGENDKTDDNRSKTVDGYGVIIPLKTGNQRASLHEDGFNLHSLTKGEKLAINHAEKENVEYDVGCEKKFPVNSNSEERCEVKHQRVAKKTKLLDWRLLFHPVFLMYAFANCLATPGYANVFVMLPDYAEENGHNRDSSALITSIIGISDLAGRLFFGWFSDLDLFPKRWGFIGCMAFSAVLNCILPSLTSFSGMAGYAVLFGFFSGSFITLSPVLLAEDLGIERLASSFGLTVLFMAVTVLVGPPICGSIKDGTGSWDMAFYFVGMLSLVGASLPLFQPCGHRWVDRRERKKKNSRAVLSDK